MKKVFILVIAFLLLIPFSQAKANLQETLPYRLAGRILLQVENYGRAWYVNPSDYSRYYMKDGYEAYMIMRTLGLGITDHDLNMIPDSIGDPANQTLVNRLKGRILLQVEKNGEAWYVNPDDGIRYYLKDGPAAYTIMRNFSLGITDIDLRQIPMNTRQLAYDGTFNTIAYASYENGSWVEDGYGDQILPPASMTKLLTAMVFLETDPEWDEVVTVTHEQLEYPKKFVGDAKTSEVDFEYGDRVSVYDLWVAMLVASSNQAATAIADASGMQRHEFINRMNKIANDLNLKKTVFVDVSGLDAHNLTTANEFAVLAGKAFEKEKIKNTSVINDYIINAIDINGELREIEVINRNYSLLKYSPQGVKTGYLVEAQRNVALQVGNKMIVVMHAYNFNDRNEIIERIIDYQPDVLLAEGE